MYLVKTGTFLSLSVRKFIPIYTKSCDRASSDITVFGIGPSFIIDLQVILLFIKKGEQRRANVRVAPRKFSNNVNQCFMKIKSYIYERKR